MAYINFPKKVAIWTKLEPAIAIFTLLAAFLAQGPYCTAQNKLKKGGVNECV
jgi:hypothetical protein